MLLQTGAGVNLIPLVGFALIHQEEIFVTRASEDRHDFVNSVPIDVETICKHLPTWDVLTIEMELVVSPCCFVNRTLQFSNQENKMRWLRLIGLSDFETETNRVSSCEFVDGMLRACLSAKETATATYILRFDYTNSRLYLSTCPFISDMNWMNSGACLIRFKYGSRSNSGWQGRPVSAVSLNHLIAS